MTTLLDRSTTFGRKLLDAANPPATKAQQRSIQSRRSQLGAYYTNLEAYHAGQSSAFKDEWMRSRGFGALPVNIRSISAIAPAVAQWWRQNLFGPAWTPDGLPTRNGQQNAIAYDSDTPEELRLAVQQAFTWGGNVLDAIRTGTPKLGNGLVEIVEHVSDDGPRGNKVFPSWVDPANVVELTFNSRGDIQSYRLAIPTKDESGQPYTRGKLVTKTEIVTYRDEHEYSYDDVPARQPNSFGFVPAVWFGHQPVESGSWFGVPAIHAGIATINAYQAQLSDISDYIARLVRQPVLLSTSEPGKMIKYLLQVQSSSGSSEEDRLTAEWQAQKGRSDRETINYQPAPKDTTATNVMQNLGLGDADPHIARTWEELELIFPEVVLERRLLDQQQVTGPGARALIANVETRLQLTAAPYNDSIVAAGQMCCAVGGELIRQGAWGLRSQLTRQQEKFAPFSLDSYASGELDFAIQPRELLPATFLERVTEAQQLERVRTAAGLAHIGYSDAEIYGDGNEPNVLPGILEQFGVSATNAAAAGDALALELTRGLLA